MTWPRVTELYPPVKIVPEMKLVLFFPPSSEAVSGLRSGVGGMWTVYDTYSVLVSSMPPSLDAPPPRPPETLRGEAGLLAETEARGTGLVRPMLRRRPPDDTVMVTGEEEEGDAVFTMLLEIEYRKKKVRMIKERVMRKGISSIGHKGCELKEGKFEASVSRKKK